MTRPPLRRMILVPLLVSVAIGFTAFAFYVDRSVHSDLIEIVDAELVRATQGQTAQPDRPAPGENPPPDDAGPLSGTDDVLVDGGNLDPGATPVFFTIGTDGNAVDAHGAENPFSEADVEALSRLGDGNHTVGEFRVLLITASGGTTSVTALDLGGVNITISGLRRSLLVGAIVVGLVLALVVWLVTSSLTRPLVRMATTARRIAGGELDTTIGEPSGSRETAELATNLDRMLQQIRSTLEASESSAAEATRARLDMQQFLADASHELRTPLTALKGYSDLYDGGMLTQPSDLDRAMGRIGSESERMSRLVNDMLELARTGAVDDAPRELVDVRAVVGDVAEDLSAAHPGMVMDVDHAAARGVEVRGDQGRVHQAILNVAANACRHAGSEAPIRLEVSRDDADVVIRVIDHGPGIEAEKAEQVFLPFFRLDPSRSRDGHDGAGLGLSVTKKIVDSHGGTIRIETTPGGGATFVITLPLSQK